MDRRSFLGKTTEMAGVGLGATLVGAFNDYLLVPYQFHLCWHPMEINLI
jgi:hypothetical protein